MKQWKFFAKPHVMKISLFQQFFKKKFRISRGFGRSLVPPKLHSLYFVAVHYLKCWTNTKTWFTLMKKNSYYLIVETGFFHC